MKERRYFWGYLHLSYIFHTPLTCCVMYIVHSSFLGDRQTGYLFSWGAAPPNLSSVFHSALHTCLIEKEGG